MTLIAKMFRRIVDPPFDIGDNRATRDLLRERAIRFHRSVVRTSHPFG